MQILLLLVLLLGILGLCLGVKTVTWDTKSFSIDGERTFLIGGSMHYPRSSAEEWPSIMHSMKDNGINLLQTYVFWNLHEKAQGEYVFTNTTEDNEDIIAFLNAAKTAGLYVNLRFGPYVCAEWNYGGVPVWIRDLTDADGKRVTFRTNDDVWTKHMLAFIDATIAAVDAANLFAGGASDGPIIMLQMENEYGNVQDFYGQDGADYVSKLVDYVHGNSDLQLPWIMCQQGEGVGTAPSADIINTCNGFYCDDWIAGHAAAFPNQPHMFTENWPGWFQKWDEATPHRPAVDVAYSVMRWFAKGGSFMNYYMAFGGTSFARSVGGPDIVTSYDYDVAVNEYGMQAEPKFTLQKQMHAALYASQDAVFGTAAHPAAVQLNNSSCESHTYSSGQACAVFLSNTGTEDCAFGKVSVPAWSVTLLTGPFAASACDVTALSEVFNSKTAIRALNSNKLATETVPITISVGKSLREKIPSSGRLSTHFSHMTPVPYLVSREPKQQLDVTKDRTDYVWYSTNVEVAEEGSSNIADGNKSRKEKATLKFDAGTGAGARCRLWLNEKEVTASGGKRPPLKQVDKAHKKFDTLKDDVQIRVPYSYDLKLGRSRPNTVDILCIGAGLLNYGPHLELIETGIVGKVLLDGVELLDWKHSVGLLGEAIDYGGVSTITSIDPAKRAELIHDLEGHGDCSDLCWRQLSFVTDAMDSSAAYALDMTAFGKGTVWVNGHMLGRYWNAVAAGDTDACAPCGEYEYTGEYQPDSMCRTGCGEASQRFYKVPTAWLKKGGEANEVVLFEEEAGSVPVREGFKLVRITMKEK